MVVGLGLDPFRPSPDGWAESNPPKKRKKGMLVAVGPTRLGRAGLVRLSPDDWVGSDPIKKNSKNIPRVISKYL